MAIQASTTLRNNRIGQLQTTIGSGAHLYIYAGAQPSDASQPDPANLLCTINLPTTFLGTPSNGAVSMVGTWSAAASAAGTAQSFRIKDSAGNTHLQGNTTTDLVLNNESINVGQTVTVTAATFTDGAA